MRDCVVSRSLWPDDPTDAPPARSDPRRSWRRTGTAEQEAYRILQRSSQDKATPMAVLARAVLESEPGLAARP